MALWTEDDETVVPPDSGSLDGALDISLQSFCPDVHAGHADVPRTPAVIAIVERAAVAPRRRPSGAAGVSAPGRRAAARGHRQSVTSLVMKLAQPAPRKTTT